MAKHAKIGKVHLTFDNEAFQEGYMSGRDMYFHGRSLSKSRELTATELIQTIAILDECGDYVIDGAFSDYQGVEESIGFLVGYLSASIEPETREEKARWLDMFAR